MQVNERIRVLIVDDDRAYAEALKTDLLSDSALDVRVVLEASKALESIEQFEPQVVILDNRFPEGEIGVSEVLPQLRGFMFPPEVIVVTAFRGEGFDLAYEARDYAAFAFRDKMDVYKDDWIFKTIRAAYENYRKKREG